MEKDSDNGKSGSWWATLPGILTALAALATATGGLIIALQQVGWVGAQSGDVETVAATGTAGADTGTADDGAKPAPTSVAAAQAVAAPASQPAQSGMGSIERQDGTVLPILSESIRAHFGEEFHLKSGQSVSVKRVARLDVLDSESAPDYVRLRLTLHGGTTIDDWVSAPVRSIGISGSNDVGPLTVSYRDIKTVKW